MASAARAAPPRMARRAPMTTKYSSALDSPPAEQLPTPTPRPRRVQCVYSKDISEKLPAQRARGAAWGARSGCWGAGGRPGLRARLVRNLQSVLAVDEGAPLLDELDAPDLVPHALRPHLLLDRALDVPDGLVFLGHRRPVEARVQVGNGNALRTQLLRHERAAHVGGSLAHVVAVVTAGVAVLHLAPGDAAALRGDHDHLATGRLDGASLQQRVRDAQRTHRADVVLLEVLLPVRSRQVVGAIGKVARVVHQDVDGLLAAQCLRHGGAAVNVGHLDALNDLRGARIEIRARLAACSNHVRPARRGLLAQRQADAAVRARDEHTCALEPLRLVHGVDVEHARALAFDCAREPGDLIGVGELALIAQRGRHHGAALRHPQSRAEPRGRPVEGPSIEAGAPPGTECPRNGVVRVELGGVARACVRACV
mmetsp:Transcript_11505/g.48258  ORF Transcript_11505/g.48258 Transcript_11505/m.48258 type:complete len:426 (+) Transcript_11505:679-1956(+)